MMEPLITIMIDPETQKAAGGKVQASNDEEEKVLRQALDIAIAAINEERQ